MSQENVEIVRSICVAWERGDFTSVEWAHPEIDYAIVGGLTPGSWKGVAGMAEAARDALSPWETFRIEVEEYRELDGERVLVLWNSKGRGKASGLETEQLRPTGAYLFQTRGGKVIRLSYYVDPAEALEAVGLTE
jgi:ketosteroid isomerase-like protein